LYTIPLVIDITNGNNLLKAFLNDSFFLKISGFSRCPYIYYVTNSVCFISFNNWNLQKGEKECL